MQDGVDVPFFNFRIAQIYLQQSDRSAAKLALANYAATPVGAQDPASDFLLAEIARQEGDLDTSAERYEAIVSRDLGDLVTRDALRGLAGVRLAQGRPEAALSVYQALLTANPDDGDSQLGQAGVAYQLQQLSQAEAETVLDRWLNGRWLNGQAIAKPPSELFSWLGCCLPMPNENLFISRYWKLTLITLPLTAVGCSFGHSVIRPKPKPESISYLPQILIRLGFTLSKASWDKRSAIWILPVNPIKSFSKNSQTMPMPCLLWGVSAFSKSALPKPNASTAKCWLSDLTTLIPSVFWQNSIWPKINPSRPWHNFKPFNKSVKLKVYQILEWAIAFNISK
ncbi:MAG: tetratricopeptide repeat protein [Leptolyngbyaceae cyanobacterium CRU_2_3]|nr:tetratricopeptide repeat protein [Leptolyngbyaceae cyanobacterium CRU_2_3]